MNIIKAELQYEVGLRLLQELYRKIVGESMKKICLTSMKNEEYQFPH